MAKITVKKSAKKTAKKKSTPRPLPHYYRKAKSVRALRIHKMRRNAGGTMVLFAAPSEKYAPIEVSDDWVDTHQPIVGGYYAVAQQDGAPGGFYRAEWFEEFYAKVR